MDVLKLPSIKTKIENLKKDPLFMFFVFLKAQSTSSSHFLWKEPTFTRHDYKVYFLKQINKLKKKTLSPWFDVAKIADAVSYKGIGRNERKLSAQRDGKVKPNRCYIHLLKLSLYCICVCVCMMLVCRFDFHN